LKQKEAVKNSAVYDNLLKRLARSALSKSYRFGTTEDQTRAHEITFDYLSKGNKVLFGLIRLSPALGRLLARAKWL